jgi:transposase
LAKWKITAQIAEELLGRHYSGVATCDRLKSYWWIKRLQWCWAHLRRDFQAMIDRGNSGTAIGKSLLGQRSRATFVSASDIDRDGLG